MAGFEAPIFRYNPQTFVVDALDPSIAILARQHTRGPEYKAEGVAIGEGDTIFCFHASYRVLHQKDAAGRSVETEIQVSHLDIGPSVQDNRTGTFYTCTPITTDEQRSRAEKLAVAYFSVFKPTRLSPPVRSIAFRKNGLGDGRVVEVNQDV